MKTSVLLLVCCLITVAARSQSAPTRIYFVKNGAQTLMPSELYTTLNPDKPILIRNNGYTLIETDADSIGVIQALRYTNDENPQVMPRSRPVYIRLERGKSYFFKTGPIVYSSHVDIDEMTERAFWLYIGINNLNKNVRKYFLSGAGGLSKRE